MDATKWVINIKVFQLQFDTGYFNILSGYLCNCAIKCSNRTKVGGLYPTEKRKQDSAVGSLMINNFKPAISS